MFYIHHIACISGLEEYSENGQVLLKAMAGNKIEAAEPNYETIPPVVLRRMGKASRISTGAALSILKKNEVVDGIIVGTANGGMEDSIKFMNQIVQYEEGLLAPGNFVQSTPNGLASQIALLTKNRNYNITHVHRGLAFENALLDTMMLLKEHPHASFLLGGVDEISTYNFNIDWLAGWYKHEEIKREDLYLSRTAGTIAGEGAAMFLVNNTEQNAKVRFLALQQIHGKNVDEVKWQLNHFLENNLPTNEVLDLMLSGENGDGRLLPFYEICERVLNPDIPVLRFKHLCGEYPTASSFALWLACKLLSTQTIPDQLFKSGKKPSRFRNLLICSTFQGYQHSFMLLQALL